MPGRLLPPPQLWRLNVVTDLKPEDLAFAKAENLFRFVLSTLANYITMRASLKMSIGQDIDVEPMLHRTWDRRVAEVRAVAEEAVGAAQTPADLARLTQASASFKASLTAHVMEGTMSVDAAREVAEIVELIEREIIDGTLLRTFKASQL